MSVRVVNFIKERNIGWERIKYYQLLYYFMEDSLTERVDEEISELIVKNRGHRLKSMAAAVTGIIGIATGTALLTLNAPQAEQSYETTSEVVTKASLLSPEYLAMYGVGALTLICLGYAGKKVIDFFRTEWQIQKLYKSQAESYQT